MNKLTLKLIIWHGVVLILTLMFWGYGSHLSGEAISAKSFDGLAVLYLVLLLAAVVIGIALFQKKIWALTLAGIVGLIYLFQFGLTQLNLLGVGIFLLLGLYSSVNSGAEISQRTKINMRRIVQLSSLPVILGLFILISFAAYQSPAIQKLKYVDRLPSQGEVFIHSLVKNTIGTQIEAANTTEKQNIISQISQQTFNQINSFLKPYFQFSPSLLAFGLFLILWGLSWIFVWLSILLGVVIFWVLKKMNFVKIETQTVKAEKLII